MERALMERVDRVYFFTREGAFFKKAYDEIARFNPYNTQNPKTELLAVSRRATFAASLKSCSVEQLMRLWTLYSQQSTRGLAVSLNLDEDLIERLAVAYGIEYRETIKYPWKDERIRSLLADETFRSHAEERIEAQKAVLVAYLTQQRFLEKGLRLIVDIGWRGSIQDNLAQLNGEIFIKGCYLGTVRVSQPAAEQQRQEGLAV